MFYDLLVDFVISFLSRERSTTTGSVFLPIMGGGGGWVLFLALLYYL